MLTLEIFSDVICPWCFIGKQRLDRILESDLGNQVELRWRSYLLAPNLPPEGIARADFLRRRHGDGAADAAHKIPSRVSAAASEEQLTLRYDLIQRVPNTRLAHHLLEWSYASDKQHALAEQLFRAYFQEGRDIGDANELVRASKSAGLNVAALGWLPEPTPKQEKRLSDQLERALPLNISAVPAYVMGGRYMLPGVQSETTFRQIIERAIERLAS